MRPPNWIKVRRVSSRLLSSPTDLARLHLSSALFRLAIMNSSALRPHSQSL
jgi:hypothetical protein